jgi:hypothetical protein
MPCFDIHQFGFSSCMMTLSINAKNQSGFFTEGRRERKEKRKKNTLFSSQNMQNC